jgi:hypothetical protein
MKCEPMPDITNLLYETRYRDKGEGLVPDIYLGMDVGDEPDTTVAGFYAVDPNTGTLTVLHVERLRARR